MAHPIFGVFGKLADGAVESVVIGSCLTKQVVNWLVNINRIRILGFTEQHYPGTFEQLDGGDKRVLRAFLDPESLSNTYSLLVGAGSLNTASEYRISSADLVHLLHDTMGTEATFDNSFVERKEGPDAFPHERWFFINGIATSRELARRGARRLQDMFGRSFTLIHNPTQGLTNDLLESAMQKFTNVNTEPVARAFVEIAKALLDAETRKVVVVAHSQGTIITGDVLDLLYLSIDQRFFDRSNMNDEDLAEFLTVSSGTVKSGELRQLSAELREAGLEVLKKLELYMFANAASRMCYADPEQRFPHIESYANEHDIVTRLGSLARDDFHKEDLIRIDGSLFTCARSGHLLNAHYLPDFERNRYELLLGHDGRCIGSSVHDRVHGNPGPKHRLHRTGPEAPRLRDYLNGAEPNAASPNARPQEPRYAD